MNWVENSTLNKTQWQSMSACLIACYTITCDEFRLRIFPVIFKEPSPLVFTKNSNCITSQYNWVKNQVQSIAHGRKWIVNCIKFVFIVLCEITVFHIAWFVSLSDGLTEVLQHLLRAIVSNYFFSLLRLIKPSVSCPRMVTR